MADGKVLYEVRADDSKVGSDLDSANKKVDQGANKLGQTAGKVAKAVGVAMAAMAAAAGAAALSFAARGVKLASDLNEVQNVVDVAFGKSSKIIDEWAKDAGMAFGLAELQAKQYAGTMGAMLGSMGIAEAQTVDMSTALAGLAGDFASFYNLEHDDAWGKIRAGIAGETEPLKQLGINMSVANMEAYALSQGLTKTYQAMSQSEQTVLRYNYLMHVSKNAQGDFSRTMDTWANNTRLAKMNLDEMSVSIGKQLLPALTGVLKTFNEVAHESGGDVTKFIANLDRVVDAGVEAAREIIPIVTALATEVLKGIVQLIPSLIDAGVDIVLGLVDGIISAIPYIIGAATQIVTKLVESLPEILGGVISSFPYIIEGLIAGLYGVEPIMANLRKEADALKRETEGLLSSVSRSSEAFAKQADDIQANAIVAEKLAKELFALSGKENKSNAEKARMRDLVTEINKLMGAQIVTLNEATGAIEQNQKATLELIKAKRDEMELETRRQQYTDLLKKEIELQDQREKTVKKLHDTYGDFGNAFLDQLASMGIFESNAKTMIQSIEDIDEAIKNNAEELVFVEGKYEALTQTVTDSAEILGTTWDKLTEHQQKAVEAMGYSVSDLADITEEQLERIVNDYDEHEAAVKEWEAKIEEGARKHFDAMGTIYDEGIKKQDITLEKATKNLEKQVEEYEKYRENMRTVASKVPPEVYAELEKMGPQAYSLIAEVAEKAPEKLDPFIAAMRAKIELSNKGSAEEVGELPELISNELKKTKPAEDEAGNVGAKVTAAIKAGLTIQKLLVLAASTDLGKSMASGAESGVLSGTQKVINAAIRMATQALAAAKKAINSSSPSKKFREQVGMTMPEGTAEGIEEGTPDVEAAAAKMSTAGLTAAHRVVQLESQFTFGAPAPNAFAAYSQPINTPAAAQGFTGPLEIPVYLDGTEIARATAPHINREMAFMQADERAATGGAW